MTAPPSSDYTVRLPAYEGPLGLLLYLIKKNEVDVYDIPVAEVARQYQEHLQLMEELNLDVAGDFFVMAATLTQIKSKMLLPRTERPDGTTEDPRQDLVNQLLEYQRVQEAAHLLEEREAAAVRVFRRPATEDGDVPVEGRPLLEVDLFSLVAAFHAVLLSEHRRRPLHMSGEKFTVEQKIREVEERVRAAGGAMAFSTLFLEATCREEMIASFLALLELLKERKLRCVQEVSCGEIFVSLRTEGVVSEGEPTDFAPPAAPDPGAAIS